MKRNKQMELFLSPQNDAWRCCFASKFNNFPSLASPLHAQIRSFRFDASVQSLTMPSRTQISAHRAVLPWWFKYNRTITASAHSAALLSRLCFSYLLVAICIISLLLSFCNYYVMVVFVSISLFFFCLKFISCAPTGRYYFILSFFLFLLNFLLAFIAAALLGRSKTFCSLVKYRSRDFDSFIYASKHVHLDCICHLVRLCLLLATRFYPLQVVVLCWFCFVLLTLLNSL